MPEGKVRVKLDHDGAILDVDEDDVEKVCRRLVEGTGGGPGWAGCPLAEQTGSVPQCPPACPVTQANAPSCDRLEDLASLVYLNESSVLHTLRQRYGASLLHTYAGPSLLVLSPRGAPAVYSEKVQPPSATMWPHRLPPLSPPPCPRSPTLPLPLGIPRGSCPLSQWPWEEESFQGVGTEGPPPTSHRGQDWAGICISMRDLSLRTFWLPWSEKPRKMWALGVRAVRVEPAKSAYPFLPSLSRPR